MLFRDLEVGERFVSPLDMLIYQKTGVCYAKRVSEENALSVSEYYFHENEDVEHA